MPVVKNYEDALNNAIENKDSKEFLNVISSYSEQAVLDAVNSAMEDQDRQILQSRGVRVLTNAETIYYNKIIEAMRSTNYRDALSNMEVTLPETVLDDVFADIEANHPVLKHLDIKHTTAKVKLIYATTEDIAATWGTLTSQITQQVAGAFVEESSEMMKLTAYVPVPLAMLDLGPTYIDQFVRTLLYEAIANGLEKAAVSNLVSSQGPIGMIADMTKGNTVSGVTTYTAKTPIAVTELTPKGMAPALEAMAVNRSGQARDPLAAGLFMIVHPLDNFSLVRPALCVKNALGEWVENKPYPFDIAPSKYIARGKAILGMDKKYFVHVGSEENGRIEWTDDFDFLNDNRTFKIKLYGNGIQKDNNAFQYLDISGLGEAAIPVEVKGTVKTKEQA